MKITVASSGGWVRAEDMERGFQIANRAYELVGEVVRSSGFFDVEIIKVTPRRGSVFHLSHARLEEAWSADFQIVCCLPPVYIPPKQEPKKDKLRLKAYWSGGSSHLIVCEQHEGRSLGSVELKRKGVEDFARALLKAIQLGIQHRQSCLGRLKGNLASIIEAPAFEVGDFIEVHARS